MFQFRELEYFYNGITWVIVWDPNNAINTGYSSNSRGGRLERFCCISNERWDDTWWTFPAFSPALVGAPPRTSHLVPRPRSAGLGGSSFMRRQRTVAPPMSAPWRRLCVQHTAVRMRPSRRDHNALRRGPRLVKWLLAVGGFTSWQHLRSCIPGAGLECGREIETLVPNRVKEIIY